MHSGCKFVHLKLISLLILREITVKIKQLAEKFPVIAVIGPRQSGKTTLVKSTFPEMNYSNLEEPDTRLFAQQDPRSFLASNPNGLIIDEVQRVPELLSNIQTFSDSFKKSGQFILIGSQNFLLQEKISQTLAGRVAVLTLLPFSLNELGSDIYKENFTFYLQKGFYPPIYDRQIEPADRLPNYIYTYIERDVRQIKNIPDLNTFTLFVKLCAGRIGQLLNLSSLANETGVSVNTVKSWLSILEASFIVFRLMPHHQNYNKRLVKMPKLYFHDTGLACSLLGIATEKQVSSHYQVGSLFENMVISELLKYRLNHGKDNNLFFWRDKSGREIDCLLDNVLNKICVEIKSGKTITAEFIKGLTSYQQLAAPEKVESFLIYGGDQKQMRNDVTLLPWFGSTKIFDSHEV